MRQFAFRQFFLLQNIIEISIASFILAVADWRILSLLLVAALPEFAVDIKYGEGVWGIWQAHTEIQRRYQDLRGHFESISSLAELKLFQNLSYFVKSIQNLFLKFQKEERKNERRRIKYQIGSVLFSQSAQIFALAWFVLAVIKGDIAIGTMTFLLASISDFRQSLSGMFRNLADQYQHGLFVNDFYEFLDIPPFVPKPKKGIKLNLQRAPEIVFENVYFRYPRTNKWAVQKFCLRIPSGEKIAFVGKNGSGKTTIIKLLCRFYDPDKGRILINGIDLRFIDLESWYSALGVLFQDYADYHFVVKEAIKLGRMQSESGFKEIKQAAVQSEADKFINMWDKKYEQMLGRQFSDGVEPSKGQWQKLALARTFYRAPYVLVLDEPTSSIDAEAEAKIFEKLELLPKDRTVILVSHRFSTVRHADRIAVIEEGKITEIGSHNQLMQNKSTYARLFDLQARSYQ